MGKVRYKKGISIGATVSGKVSFCKQLSRAWLECDLTTGLK